MESGNYKENGGLDGEEYKENDCLEAHLTSGGYKENDCLKSGGYKENDCLEAERRRRRRRVAEVDT